MLREAVTAAKAGDKPTARRLLQEVLASSPENEQAWLWRAAVAESREEAMQHLERVLQINPGNQQALSTLAAYRIARPRGAAPTTASAGSPGAHRPTPPPVTSAAMAPAVQRNTSPMPAPLAGTTSAAPVVAVPVRGATLPPLRTAAAPRLQTAAQAAWGCPICAHSAPQALDTCPQCRSVLTVYGLDDISKASGADEKLLQAAIERLAPLTSGPNPLEAHKALALAHLNLKNSTEALPHLLALQKLLPEDANLRREVTALQARKVIMVVDDSPTVRRVVALTLEKNLYRVVLAPDGMAALAKLNEHSPHLVLLDITMPRMDGYQVCKIIKQNAFTKGIPVVMLSGNDGFFDKVKGKMAGATDYITKPFDPATLLKSLARFVKN